MNGDHVFHIGDRVVYPNHGVGIIEQTTVEKFYLLKIPASSLKVMVPFANVDSVGMRPVVRNGEVQKGEKHDDRQTKALGPVPKASNRPCAPTE